MVRGHGHSSMRLTLKPGATAHVPRPGKVQVTEVTGRSGRSCDLSSCVSLAAKAASSALACGECGVGYLATSSLATCQCIRQSTRASDRDWLSITRS
jgi:transcriptional regulator with GAF, ATPase, and Fis domain